MLTMSMSDIIMLFSLSCDKYILLLLIIIIHMATNCFWRIACLVFMSNFYVEIKDKISYWLYYYNIDLSR